MAAKKKNTVFSEKCIIDFDVTITFSIKVCKWNQKVK